MKMFLLVILTLVGTATLTQFIRLARFPFRLAFWAVLVLLYFSLSGCVAHAQNLPLATNAFAAFFGMALAIAIVFVMFGGWFDGWKPALVALIVAAALFLGGCATLPMPLQPQNEQYNSNMAEGAWLVLDGIDTLQTMHLKRDRNPTTVVTCNREADPLAVKIYGGQYPSPSRVLLTNIALATVHTMVTSWLDDEVAKHDQANDGSVGPWYVGRVVWHAASIAFSLRSVINNAKQGCKL